jgi:hydrogenase maturation protease
MPRTVVIGVGNDFRGDDAAGLLVVRRLAAFPLPPGTDLHESSGEPASLMALWHGADRLVVIDAARSGASPGHVERFDVSREALPAAVLPRSTHAFGLAEALELSRALRTLPPRAEVWAIEGHAFTPGAPVSPETQAAADAVTSRVAAGLVASRE